MYLELIGIHAKDLAIHGGAIAFADTPWRLHLEGDGDVRERIYRAVTEYHMENGYEPRVRLVLETPAERALVLASESFTHACAILGTAAPLNELQLFAEWCAASTRQSSLGRMNSRRSRKPPRNNCARSWTGTRQTSANDRTGSPRCRTSCARTSPA